MDNLGCLEDPHYTLPTLEDSIPFLELLQGNEPQPPLPPPPVAAETAAEFLFTEDETFVNGMIMELLSPDIPPLTQNLSPTKTENQSKKVVRSKRTAHDDGGAGEAAATPKERRKRKREGPASKKNERDERQRMKHIELERNRRFRMKEQLHTLRTMIPSLKDKKKKEDQASILGETIDYIKQLEHHLESLQAHKTMRQSEDQNGSISTTSTSTSSSSNFVSNLFMASLSSSSPSSPQLTNVNGNGSFAEYGKGIREKLCAEKRSSLAHIKVLVNQNHVNLEVQCQRRPEQLPKAIAELQDLRLSVLHLNITSLHSLVLFSFILKIEDDGKLRSPDEIASTVHQIFS